MGAVVRTAGDGDGFAFEIGIVFQEPLLWNDSLENNIRYAKASATSEEVANAAKLSGLDEFAESLPKGYQTIVGENACKISEGQKQRIAIARALVKKPKILILDEAFSSLDSHSEEMVLASIKKAQRNSTLIVTSHRLSTVLSADLIYFVDSSGELRIGRGEEMLKVDRRFSALFAGQVRN